MKFSISSILLASAAWTVQAIPTAIPSSLGGRARGVSTGSGRQAQTKRLTEHTQLPYNAVRSIYQSQHKLARQEGTATSDTQIPDATSVADTPVSEPLPLTSVIVVTSDPAVITSVTNIPTSEPLLPITTNVIISEPTEITSVVGIPTTEPLLPPTTTDEITSEAITLPETFLIKVRQQTQVATPIETFPATPTPVLPTDIPTAVETFVVSPTAVLPTEVPTAVETLIARSPYTASPPTTTSA